MRAQTGQRARLPLAGIRVLELDRYISGPYEEIAAEIRDQSQIDDLVSEGVLCLAS
ncbi:hypothetical protein ABZ863_30360 [Saccharomonospora sp. NPDC046836]|uniref:hypothetical protein n=1 Tax=Saccharomonospora sp. NPDC046836 TaxID=3156921 RepID=UPI0033F18E45